MNVKKLVVIQGIPGSGKSTLARKLLKEDKSYKTVIVSKDSIRNSLGEYWIPSREDLVSKLELEMIQTSLEAGYTVISDGTNLNPKMIKNLKNVSKRTKTAIEYKTITISPKKAFRHVCWRWLKGGRFISRDIIENFYSRYKESIGV